MSCGVRCPQRAVGIEILILKRLRRVGFLGVCCPKLAPHLPAYPEKQNATCQQQADNLQQLRGRGSKYDTKQRCRDYADEDGLVPLLLWKSRCRKADDDRIVAGQHQIDHDNLQKGCQRLLRDEFTHMLSLL